MAMQCALSRQFQIGQATKQKMPTHWHHILFHILCALALHFAPEGAAAASATQHMDDADAVYLDAIMREAKVAEMRNYMNETVDPCHNFYTFACGNWAKINPANSRQRLSTGQFERLIHGHNLKVAKMLNMETDPHDTVEDKKVKSFYKACMRLGELSSSYQEKLKQLIAEFGTMPVLVGNDWQESHFDWIETTARMSHRYGISPIIAVEVMTDISSNEFNIAYIGPPNLPLESRGMYLDAHTAVYRDLYRDGVAKKLRHFLGLSPKLARSTADELMDFEVQLASGLTDQTDGIGMEELTDLTTVAEMQRRYAPTLDIERLVNVTLGERINDTVYEFNSQYQTHLLKVMPRVPLRTVANYIFFNLIDAFAKQPQDKVEKQRTTCIDTTKKYFAKNLDNMIYRRYKTDSTSSDIELMWQELKATFKSTLQSYKLMWISRQTRQLAIEKLEAMTLVINSYSSVNFTAEFEGLELQDHDYVENVRQSRIVATRMSRAKLHQPAEPLDVGAEITNTPANVLVENSIKVPVALLQPYYMWAANYPNAIKFGALASLIGHELIHGFDDDGRKYDKRGNLQDWWDTASTKNFLERRRCFTQQYSGYFYNGRQLPVSEAQSENIADNGGVRLAYAAYLKWYDGARKEGRLLGKETLPKLNYNSKQLFFLSYAQIWCYDVHWRLRDAQVSTDQHVPQEFRVIGPLSNFPEFANAFSCAIGTRMNPRKKCEIY